MFSQVFFVNGEPISMAVSIFAGLAGGLIAGMLGIGGGIAVIPMLIAIGVPPSIAAASMSVAIIANASGATVYNLKSSKIDWQLGILMGLSAVLGSQVGIQLIKQFKQSTELDQMITGCFIPLLIFVGWRVYRGSKQINISKEHSPLLDIPLKYHSKILDQKISPIFPMILSVLIGFLAALIGIGGGVFYIPVLLYLFKDNIINLVPVSQIAVMIAALSTASGHVLNTDKISVPLSLILIITGSLGTSIGSRLKLILSNNQLQKLLAFVLAGGAVRMLIKLVLPASSKPQPTSVIQESSAWLESVYQWSEVSLINYWLATAGFALLFGPLMALILQNLYSRIDRFQNKNI
jgi:uncharacterized protein